MISLRARRVITGLDEGGDVGDVGDSPRWVTVDGRHVVDVGSAPLRGAAQHDLGDVQLWPGITDLHADSLQHFESPRPGTRIPLREALYDYAVDAVTHGITQPYLCVSIGEGPDSATVDRRALSIIETLDGLAAALPMTVEVHLRVDVGNPDAVGSTRVLLDRHGDLIRLVSAMDHTPGQGQYRDEQTWRSAMGARLHLDDAGLDHWLAVLHCHAAGTSDRRRQIASLATELGAVFAVHDPDGDAAVSEAHRIGARICEFPLTAEAAASACRRGIVVVMGAPNAWRGVSHLRNLSAREAISAGTAHVLTSDYHSGAMVRAAMALDTAGVCSLDTAVAMISRRPTEVMASSGRPAGVLAAGQLADLIAVRTRPVAAVAATWSAGRQVSGPPVG